MSSDLVYGIHSVYNALKAGRRECNSLLLNKTKKPDPKVQEIEKIAQSKSIPYYNYN
jgi:23S rRNA (guanosine2251-2'-O)-methyltransferase